MPVIAALWQRLRREGGYAMVTVLGVMFVASLAAVAGVTATDWDLEQGAADKDSKRAYAAAEAGVQDYLARLAADVDYWTRCGSDPDNPALNQRWNGSGADPRGWATIPGTTARYAIEVLPANGATQCIAGAQAAATFIDDATGVFRIRATGQARPGSEKRSIVASFRRRGFLDFVYFTDYETFPAEFVVTRISGWQTRVSSSDPQTYVDWARLNCEKYFRDGRGLSTNVYRGQAYDPNDRRWENVTLGCVEIQFRADGNGIDKQKGPFHTNDEILVCGEPWFGEKPSDNVEVSAPAPPGGTGGSYGSASGWRPSCSGSAPKVNDPTDADPDDTVGTWRKSSPIMTLPPSNANVADEALPAYSFVGRTTIVMNGDSMVVTGKRASGQVLSGVTLPIPADGVVAVGHDGACGGLDVLKPLSSPATCGDLWIEGTYTRNVTFTAANDILVRGNVIRADDRDVMLGLIASQFVRVHHPTTIAEGYACGSNAQAPGTTDRRIDAAILAVNKSFYVDKWWCGESLGTLTVNGAIAQQFRGTVGQTGAGAHHGYTKDYNYDRRLRFRSPPRFLDPVQSSWRLLSQVEQVPAT